MANYDKVFQANPNAILGATWGSVANTPVPSSTVSQTTPKSMDSPSNFSMAPSANSDSEYEDITDDEDVPLQIASWGTQAVSQSTASDWKTLVDPNFKPKAGGVGSGNLHRRGANFKPVDESLILNQRMNSQTKTKGKPKTGSLGKSVKSKASYAAHIPPVKHNKAQKPQEVRIPRLPTRMRPSNINTAGGGVGGWGTGQLSAQPFWQQPSTQPPLIGNHHATPQLVAPPMSAPATTTKTNAPFKAPPVIEEKTEEPAKTQLLQINIELAPGMSAGLSVFEGDEPSTLVERFAKDHRIDMTEDAKKSFGITLSKLVEAKLRQRQAQS